MNTKKRSHVSLFIFLFFISITLFQLKAQPVVMLTKKIEYKVNIKSGNELCQFCEFIDTNARQFFIQDLIESAKKGTIKAYHDKNLRNRIPAEKIPDLLSYTDTVLMPALTDYDSDTIIIAKEEFNYNHISSLAFQEKWIYNPHTHQLSKKIIAIGLIRESEHHEFQINTILFWLKLED